VSNEADTQPTAAPKQIVWSVVVIFEVGFSFEGLE
jgi:hypothetical protein